MVIVPTNDWLNSLHPAGWVATKTAQRAASTAKRINDKPAAVVLLRNGVALPEQTVRVETVLSNRHVGVITDSLQQSYMHPIVMFGTPDFDVQVGDQFGYQNSVYRVTGVTIYPGEVQAQAERYQ